MAQKFVKKWFEPGEIDGEIVKIKDGQSLKAMEGGSEVDLIKIQSGKVMLKGAEAALQSDISALESDIETALNSAKSYADGKISDLVNGAPVALDTLKELADKLGDGEDALNALITQVDENLQDAKDYTDAQIAAIPPVDLSSFETIANVDSKDAAKLVEAKAYTDAQIAAIPAVDLSGFYTKSEVDSKESALDSRLDVIEPKVSSLESSASSLQSSVSSLQSSISSEVSRAEAAEQALDGRLDILEPKMTSVESDISDLEGADLDLRDDLNQEISDRQSADAAKLVEAKAYTDSKIAAIPATDLSGFYTKSEIDSKESALDSKISTEKGRVDAILSASQADKDTFAEIVQLINQVDTTNDQAFAAFALATNDSLDALDGRLDVAEPKISTLETKVSSLESEMDQAQSDIGSLDGRLDVAEPKISSLESNMSTAQSNISTLQGKVSVLESEMDVAQSDISSAQADISALETDVASLMGVVAPEVKEDEEIIPSVLTHVDLEKEALKIYKVCVGRVSVFKNVDYSVSVVGGKTRLTWIGDMASGGSHPVALSDKIYCTYLHAGSGGGVNSNAITWFSGNINKYTLGSNGGLTKVIDGMDGSAITNETAFSGPFEITYSFNGYLSNYGFIGFSSNSGNSSKDGSGYFVAFNGSSQPGLGTSSSPNFQFPSYGINDLSSGLNTITFKMNSSGAVSIVVNGVETALGSVNVANQYYAAARLATFGEVITSSTKV